MLCIVPIYFTASSSFPPPPLGIHPSLIPFLPPGSVPMLGVPNGEFLHDKFVSESVRKSMKYFHYELTNSFSIISKSIFILNAVIPQHLLAVSSTPSVSMLTSNEGNSSTISPSSLSPAISSNPGSSEVPPISISASKKKDSAALSSLISQTVATTTAKTVLTTKNTKSGTKGENQKKTAEEAIKSTPNTTCTPPAALTTRKVATPAIQKSAAGKASANTAKTKRNSNKIKNILAAAEAAAASKATTAAPPVFNSTPSVTTTPVSGHSALISPSSSSLATSSSVPLPLSVNNSITINSLSTKKNDKELRTTKSSTKEFLVGAINKPPLSKISVSSLSPNNYLLSSNLLTTKDTNSTAAVAAVAAPVLQSTAADEPIITATKKGSSAMDPNLDSMISLAGLKAKVTLVILVEARLNDFKGLRNKRRLHITESAKKKLGTNGGEKKNVHTCKTSK